jgi:hypothetical protein
MNKAIWKYVLPVESGIVEIFMPTDAQILKVGEQNDQICIWVAVAPDEQTTTVRQFITHGTGHHFDWLQKYRYLDTVMLLQGRFVGVNGAPIFKSKFERTSPLPTPGRTCAHL